MAGEPFSFTFFMASAFALLPCLFILPIFEKRKGEAERRKDFLKDALGCWVNSMIFIPEGVYISACLQREERNAIC